MRIERKGSLAWRRIGDETIIVHLERKRMYCLNRPGSEAWDRLAESTTVQGVVDTGADVGREAMLRFVAELASEDLVSTDGEVESPPEPAGAVPGPPPPRIQWSEPIERFAGLCAFRAGQDLSCNQNPYGS